MIKKALGYLITPGIWSTKAADVNPLRSAMEMRKQHKELREQVEATEDRPKKFRDVNREKAKKLFRDEIVKFRVTEEKLQAKFHNHVAWGAVWLLLGFTLFSLPVIGLFSDLGIRIPYVSNFVPIFTYGSIFSMSSFSLVFLLQGAKHFYFAKMIKLRQRFTFMQYVRSWSWLPNKNEVVF